MDIYIYIYEYTYTYIYTYIHIYTHIRWQMYLLGIFTCRFVACICMSLIVAFCVGKIRKSNQARRPENCMHNKTFLPRWQKNMWFQGVMFTTKLSAFRCDSKGVL